MVILMQNMWSIRAKHSFSNPKSLSCLSLASSAIRALPPQQRADHSAVSGQHGLCDVGGQFWRRGL